MLTYKEALNYIYSFTDYEKKSSYRYAPENFDLGRMERLLALLDNPHRRFKSIHIAGTKGKGSTSAMIASILNAAGYKTGLYTSPHLHTFRERIRIGRELISEEAVADLIQRLRPLVSQVEGLTTFEIITALAFAYFAQEGVDFAVLEVGMGGRLDATNVVEPLVAVITSISYDHTHILGHTLTLIAREKAGIIKPGAPVISAPQDPEAMAAIEEVVQERGALLFRVDGHWAWQLETADLEGQLFSVRLADPRGHVLWQAMDRVHSNPIVSPTYGLLSRRRLLHLYRIPLLGRHQLVNTTTAIAITDLLGSMGFEISENAISQGLRDVRWPGRLEILSRKPFLIADSTHNADSASKLVAALKEYFPYQHLILVFGASSDKDIDGMFRELLPHAQHVIITRSDHPRAADPRQLGRKAREHGCLPIVCDDLAVALEQALDLAGRDDLICATGSIFIVAGVREVWAGRTNAPLPDGDVPERDP
ncbi:MAG: folylpolyglutamate synthase/dihydrofolate synthase family protein [Anaerolineae bacterium]